jgi:type I restriction enzyme, S subunit
MAGDWIECKLADACSSIDYGLTASATEAEGGPRFLRITDIVSGHIDWNSVPHVIANEETAAKYELHDGDIVLARTGASTGASSYVKSPPPAVFASYLVRLQAKPEFDPRFLAYYLKSKAFWVFIRGVLGDKSAQPNASASTMTQAPLRAPRSKYEQRAIAHILGALDDKIELNWRMNETLEAVAQALFKSWFVDFDPVRAKAEGRDPGLPKPLFELFPDTLDGENKPIGWLYGRLADVADVIMGSSPPGETYNDSGIGMPLVNGPAEYGAFFLDKKKWTTEPTRVCRTGDLIVCVRGSTTGRHAFADDEYCLGRGVCAIRAFDSAQVLLNRQVLDHLPELLSKTTGSVFPNLSGDDIKSFRVLLPPAPLAKLYCGLVNPLDRRIWANVSESRTLAALRDTLLPKLISGELRVKDAERVVAEAAA